MIELGFKALHGNPLPVVARPFLEELSEQVHDTVHLGVVDGDSVLYLEKLPGTRGAEMRSRVGHRMPLTRTGVGMALLLDSPERWEELYIADEDRVTVPTVVRRGELAERCAEFCTRMQTYAKSGSAMDLEDNEPGIRCVAARCATPRRPSSGRSVCRRRGPTCPPRGCAAWCPWCGAARRASRRRWGTGKPRRSDELDRVQQKKSGGVPDNVRFAAR